MVRHLQREIENLKSRLFRLCAVVEQQVAQATRALEEGDAEPAKSVIRGDIEIDHTEVEIEEECLKILALYQPVAVDLRVIVSILKINNDMERIGDLAVNIAERAQYLARHPCPLERFDYPDMADKVMKMVRSGLDALSQMSADLAHQVCAADNEVDAINRRMYRTVGELIRKGEEDPDSLIHLLSISRHYERIADHATNIAEDVIYMISGEIVRHKTEEYAD